VAASSALSGIHQAVVNRAMTNNRVAIIARVVNIFFLLLAPEGAAGLMLKALARVSNFLKNKYYRRKILEAKDKAAVVMTIEEEEKTKQ